MQLLMLFLLVEVQASLKKQLLNILFLCLMPLNLDLASGLPRYYIYYNLPSTSLMRA